jgi:hypothetical protein
MRKVLAEKPAARAVEQRGQPVEVAVRGDATRFVALQRATADTEEIGELLLCQACPRTRERDP